MGTIEDAIQAAELIDDRIGRAADTTQKAQEATRELREAISEAKELRRSLEGVEARIMAFTDEAIRERIETTVTEKLDVLGRMTEEQMRKSVAKVISEFDMLKDSLLGLDERSKPSIPEMIDEMHVALKLQWPVFLNAIKAAQATLRGCSNSECDKSSKWAVLAMMQLPDGKRGESHMHFCTSHKEALKKDPAITILKSFRLETTICPYPHDDEQFRPNLEE